ncbi:MAG: cation-translocating P-type ATPase [Armatimonadota bacterium]
MSTEQITDREETSVGRGSQMAPRGDVITAEVEQVYDHLGTSHDGLSEQEAAERLEKYGRNVVSRFEPYPLWKIALDQFTSPIIYVLLVAAVITLLLRDYTDTIIIMAVVIINAIVGFYQEHKAARAMQALREMATPEMNVRRDGKVKRVSSEELVPGDLVLVDAGMRAAADMRLVRCLELLADESALTGESDPVYKVPEPLDDPDTLPADTINVVHAGSMVVEGHGEAVVFATGSHSELGKIAETVAEVVTTETPLQRRLHRFANILAYGMVLLAIVTVVVGLLRGMDLLTVFLTAVALAVSVIPEGLPIVVTAVLSIGVWRMAERQVLVRKLPAAETMGSVNYICSDKTGTITQNEMTVQTVMWGRYGVHTRFIADQLHPEIESSEGFDAPMDGAEELAEIEQLMRVAVFCSNAEYIRDEDGNVTTAGSPTELALLRLADGLFPDLLRQSRDELAIDEVPFSSARKFMATLQPSDDGEAGVLYVKGAPEVIFPRCDHEWDPGQDEYIPFDEEYWAEQADCMGRQGQRVIAIAQRPWSKNSVEAEEVHGIVLWGLVGIQDPPRAEAAEAIRGCRESGINVTMITGDHPATAMEISRQVGLLSDAHSEEEERQRVVTGAEMLHMSDEELDERVEDVRVYARITPHDKLRVVEALQRRNRVVAVTGDGVNDAPALRRADIGVSMGQAGTEAAREASDVVLLDDSFASIYEAVKLGRYMFETIRKTVFFLISSGAGEVIALLAALAINWQYNGETALPFLAAQILWINLVTNGLQDVALAFEPGEDFVLKRPPRGSQARIFDRIVVTYTIIIGIIFGVGTLVMFRYVLVDSGYNIELAQTAAVTMMVMFQVMHVLNCRSLVRSVFRVAPFSNPFLAISIPISLIAQFGFIYWAPMQNLFGTQALPLNYWVYIILMSLTATVAMELGKIFVRHRGWHLR